MWSNVLRVKIFRSTLLQVLIELNTMELTWAIQLYQKNICYKNGNNIFNFSCIGSYKRLWIHYVLYLEMTGRIFSSISGIQYPVSSFQRILQKIVDTLCSIPRNDWKSIFGCFMRSFNIIVLHLCTICDTHGNLQVFLKVLICTACNC